MHDHAGTEIKITAARKLALVGNPNVGKSVVFNHLTGRYVTVSNYPGTTVELLRGIGMIDGSRWEIVDTPGVNTLFPKSEDERVTRDLIINERPDVIVQVADAKNLRRALMLTLGLVHFQVPMILVLNMSDEARERGITIDTHRLSSLTGVPVVETVAITGEGLPGLKHFIAKAAIPRIGASYPDSLVSAVKTFAGNLPNGVCPQEALSLVILAEENGAVMPGWFGNDTALTLRITQMADDVRKKFVRPFRLLILENMQAKAQEVTGQVLVVSQTPRYSWIRKFSLVIMRPFPGYIIVALVLWVMYEFVGVFAAGTAVDFIENTLFGKFINPAAAHVVRALLPYQFLQDMLVGPYGIITMALTYAFALILPIVSAFFIFFSLLEDSGYLPRLAAMLDRLMRLIGLNGKAVLPLILGLGCDTMATLTTRTLDTRKERMVVTLLLSLSIPCSAQLGVVMGMSAGLGWKIMALWILITGAVTAGVGWVGAKLLPGSRSPFLIEIPPVRRPKLSNVFHKVKARLTWYLKEVIPLFVIATLALFIFDRIGFLKVIIDTLSPVVVNFLGLPHKATEALIIGFFRRDYGAAGFFTLAKAGLMSKAQVLVSMVVITLFMPCVAQVLITVKERGIKAAAFITLFVLTFSIMVGGALNWILHV